jgi:hypothetical protein
MLLVMAGPVAIDAVPWLMYFIFSVCTVFAVPFVYFCVPETRGVSLEELDFVFKEGPVRQSGKRNKIEWQRRRAMTGGLDTEASDIATKHIHESEGHDKSGDSKEIDLEQVEYASK